MILNGIGGVKGLWIVDFSGWLVGGQVVVLGGRKEEGRMLMMFMI